MGLGHLERERKHSRLGQGTDREVQAGAFASRKDEHFRRPDSQEKEVTELITFQNLADHQKCLLPVDALTNFTRLRRFTCFFVSFCFKYCPKLGLPFSINWDQEKKQSKEKGKEF